MEIATFESSRRFGHIDYHSLVRNTWKQRIQKRQRGSKTKGNPLKPAINDQKSFSKSLGPEAYGFDSRYADQNPSEIADFRGVCIYDLQKVH